MLLINRPLSGTAVRGDAGTLGCFSGEDMSGCLGSAAPDIKLTVMWSGRMSRRREQRGECLVGLSLWKLDGFRALSQPLRPGWTPTLKKLSDQD